MIVYFAKYRSMKSGVRFWDATVLLPSMNFFLNAITSINRILLLLKHIVMW